MLAAIWGHERRGPQDQVVAARMSEFFDELTRQQRADPQEVARRYATDLAQHRGRLLAGKRDSRSPYYVGLSAGPVDFNQVTKRVTLVTDTMLLTEHRGSAHELGFRSAFPGVPGIAPAMARAARERYGVVSEDLAALGRRLLDAEPLLRTGLAWFCPQYVTGRALPHFRTEQLPAGTVEVADYLVEHGRAVDLSSAKPLASRVVRPVLEIDLPFLDGLSLADFAQVTREEFDSYRLFRDFMRARLLELDGALEAEDSQVQLERLALAIREEIEAARASLSTASRTRPLTRAGAVVSSTSAILAAVRPGALTGALATTTTAVSGLASLWPAIQAYADRARDQQGKWHYVWVLQRKAR